LFVISIIFYLQKAVAVVLQPHAFKLSAELYTGRDFFVSEILYSHRGGNGFASGSSGHTHFAWC
jgi:hypothetical protein